VKTIKTIPLVARGPSLVEGCHAKWQRWIAAQWLAASGTDMQTVAPPGTLRRSCAPALEGSQQQIHWSVPVSLQRSAVIIIIIIIIYYYYS